MNTTFPSAESANRFGQDANMAPGSLPNRRADMNVNVIYRFNRGDEELDQNGHILADGGWVCSAASSIL